MGNALSREKWEQVIALGRLGWSLRRIEQATGIRRETAGDYLRSAGIGVRSPGSWGEKSLSKPATLVTTGFLPKVMPPEQAGRRSVGVSEAYREMIELELSRRMPMHYERAPVHQKKLGCRRRRRGLCPRTPRI
jgi:hypothetical protein